MFDGFGALLVPAWNKCAAVPGKSFDLPSTLKLAVDAKVAVGMWGPYEISEPGFALGVKRLHLLEKGGIKYVRTTVVTGSARKRSIASMPCRIWTTCSLMADFWTRVS